MSFSQDDPHPEGFAVGDWVAQFDCNPQRPRIAKVRDEYADPIDKSQRLVDLVLYEHNGTRIGRESPACGGPRGFEPACPASRWTPIEEPDFPYLAELRHEWAERVKIRKLTGAPAAVTAGDDGEG